MKKLPVLFIFGFIMAAFFFTTTSCTPNNTVTPVHDTIYIHDTTKCIKDSTSCLGAVACYPFEGNTNDASGNNFNGTLHGATLATGRKGNANGSYHFGGYKNGNPDYIELPTLQNINNTEEISISMWLKVDSTIQTGGTPFTMMPDDASDRLNAHINYLPFQLVWDNGDISGSGRVFQYRTNSFIWNHYVFIKSATNNKMQVYLNNVLVINENKHDDISNKNKNIRLGGGAGNTNYFAGWMDDVKIFNKALNATEVNTLFNE